MLGSQEMDPSLLSGFTKNFVFTKEFSVGKHEGKKKIETVSLFVSGILALFGTIIMFLSIIKMIIKKINKHFLCHQWSSVDAKVCYKKISRQKFWVWSTASSVHFKNSVSSLIMKEVGGSVGSGCDRRVFIHPRRPANPIYWKNESIIFSCFIKNIKFQDYRQWKLNSSCGGIWPVLCRKEMRIISLD